MADRVRRSVQDRQRIQGRGPPCIPQAAASTALIKLRAHFGDQLFSRTARGMLPTPYAEAIQPSLRAVLGHLEQARASRGGFEPAEAQRTMRCDRNGSTT